MYYVTANPSTAQTNTVLIPAVSGERIVLQGIYISSDTETTVTFLNGTTHSVLHRLYVGARGGLVLPLVVEGVSRGLPSIVGEGVDYSTADAGNVFIGVHWRLGSQ